MEVFSHWRRRKYRYSREVTGLIQDGTVSSGIVWKECKYFPNDLEENQIRTISEEACQNKPCLGGAVRELRFVFQNYQKNRNKNQSQSHENFPGGTGRPEVASIFHQCGIQTDTKKLTVEVRRLCQDPSSLATPHRDHALLFSVWSTAMELKDNQPHGCLHWLVTPFQGQKRSTSPLI